MKPYPHHYLASASARAVGSVEISAHSLPAIETAAPPEFDGPAGVWSPEMLLCAAVADCFVLTFRALARAAHFNWFALDCEVEGVLEHKGNTTQFTRFATTARLTVAPGADHARARLLLGRAEHGCLVSNSLRGERTLATEVVSLEAGSPPPDDRRPSAGERVGSRAVARASAAEIRRLS